MIKISQNNFDNLLAEVINTLDALREAGAYLNLMVKACECAEQQMLSHYQSLSEYNERKMQLDKASKNEQDAQYVFSKAREAHYNAGVELRKIGTPFNVWFRHNKYAIAMFRSTGGEYPITKLWSDVTEKLGHQEAVNYIAKWW
jgi:hypothetical protein